MTSREEPLAPFEREVTDDISIATAPFDSTYPLNSAGTTTLFSGRLSLTAIPDLGVILIEAVLLPFGAALQSTSMTALMVEVPEG